jgi:hypothetical protein
MAVAALAGCSSHPQPPTGRWQGYYEAPDVMIAARLEISPTGTVRVSAPNAFADIASMSASDKAQLRNRLESGLAAAWPKVVPLDLEFDGKVFRKPSGIAPQIEWDKDKGQMTLFVYAGTHATIRVPLESVENFDSP